MVVRSCFSHTIILLTRREHQWMVVWFSKTKVLLEERGPVDGCEVWFTHTIILLEERGPVDCCEWMVVSGWL
jgi:hypothetical protein